MKCVDCGLELNEDKKEVELHVTLHNPGSVSAKGSVIECQNCNQHYVDETEALRLMEAFENDRLTKNKH